MHTIKQSSELPPSLARNHREVNLLWYEPSVLFVAKENNDNEPRGVIRTDMREHHSLRHGFISDLHINPKFENQSHDIAQELISHAETYLISQKATKIDAVVLDGFNLTKAFTDEGYWASRKTVAIAWDLAEIKKPGAASA